MTKLRLLSILVCSLSLAACTQLSNPASDIHITPSATAPQVMVSATTESTATPASTAVATTSPATSNTSASATPLAVPPAPTSASANSTLAIHSFEIVSIEDLAQGKRFTFRWSASGESAMIISGTQQRFEHGRMFWLESEKMIVVLYDESPNSTLFRFEDTWAEGQPESDPTLVAPPGLYQPVRGFGKVWREGFEVRQRLGWALTREQGYEARFQSASNESIGGTFYLSTLDGQVLKLQGYDVGSGVWELLPSAVVIE